MIFFCRHSYKLFSFQNNSPIVECSGVITDSLSCLEDWFCKCFSIITTAVYIPLDYSGKYGVYCIVLKGTESFDVQELEVCMATYGPKIDQSQHAKSVGHVINHYTCM